jgi:hypothetical protein
LRIRAHIVLTFTPDGNLPDDRDIGFVPGIRDINIEVPANSAIDPGGFAFQAGTTAGVIRISIDRVTLPGSETNIAPLPLPSYTVVVNRRAPVIYDVTIGTRTASSFEVVIQGYSNIRSVTQGTFRFTARAGGNLQTESITIDLNNDFTTWFAGNSASLMSGGKFRSVTTFTVQGDVNAISSVSVTLTNAVGTSQPGNANF